MYFLVLSLGNMCIVCKGACIGMFLCRTKVLLAYLVWCVAVDSDTFSNFLDSTYVVMCMYGSDCRKS